MHYSNYRYSGHQPDPAKVWDRVLTEVNEEVKSGKKTRGSGSKDRFDEEVNKKVKEFEEREDRNATLRYDEAYQKERTEELERYKQDLKQRRDVEMTSRQAEKPARKLLLIALKEINTAITFNKIRFVEAIEANQILSAPIWIKGQIPRPRRRTQGKDYVCTEVPHLFP